MSQKENHPPTMDELINDIIALIEKGLITIAVDENNEIVVYPLTKETTHKPINNVQR